MKACSTCKKLLPLSSYQKNAGHRDGHQTNCSACTSAYGKKRYRENVEQFALYQRKFYQANKTKIDARNRKWEVTNKERISVRRKTAYPKHRTRILAGQKKYRFYSYGITEEIFTQMIAAQGGLCALCGTAFSEQRNMRPCIDHDHACCAGAKSCGKCIRGILCFNCNTFLGHARDSMEILKKAIEYLGQARQKDKAA